MVPGLDPPIEIETAANPNAAVIWLHGLGADGNDFAGIVPEFGLPAKLAVRFVFPHAPMRPVTINGGYVMRAWYDIAPGDAGFRQNAAHIGESVRAVHSMIDQEKRRGVAPARIVIGGFSQGGAIAAQAALHFGERLAGAVILSAPVANAETLVKETAPANADLPVFLAHGTHDPMVPFDYGERLQTELRAHRRPVEWHAYPLEHSVNLDEIRDIGRFLATVLA
jgi:phospholipase/carboxylesterase